MEQEKKSNTKIWLNIIIVIVILFAGMTVVGSLQDLSEVFKAIQGINIWYFLIAVFIGLLGMVLMSISSQIVFRAINKDLNPKISFLIQAVEPFFNGITPFSSGAQPFQIYFYKTHKVEAQQSTSVLLVNFILFQISSVGLSSLGLIIFWDKIQTALGASLPLMLIGYGINTLVLVGLFLIAYVKKFKFLVMGIIDLLAKIKFLNKRMVKAKVKSEIFVNNFQSGVKFLFTKKRVFILGLLTKIVSIIFTYGTTIFIAISLHGSYETVDFVFMMFAGFLAATSMFFVPLPGGSGGTEFVFSLLFVPVTQGASITIMLLWRLITYYFAMIYGFIGYLLLKRVKVEDKA